MKIKKILLSLGIFSLAALPIISMSCSRYSNKYHDEIRTEINKFKSNNYLTSNKLLPIKLKIPSIDTPLTMKYKYNYISGSIEWSININGQKYWDTASEWKPYPTLNILPPKGEQWGSWTIPVYNKLELNVISNSYTPIQYIDISQLNMLYKKDAKSILNEIVNNIINNNIIDNWTTASSDTYKTQIEAAIKGSELKQDIILKSIKNIKNISIVFFVKSPENQHWPPINTDFLNCLNLNACSTKKEKKEKLINWINEKNNNIQLNKIFGKIKSLDLSDLQNIINSIHN